MEFLNWDSLDKTFYLLDTFEGLDLRYCSNEDIKAGAEKKNETALQSGAYVKGVESVKANFSQWNNIKIIKGSIPETLNQVDTSRVAYLHVDMNCSPPEVAAMNWFWDRLLPGAVVLFDDYAYRGYETQKHALVCSPTSSCVTFGLVRASRCPTQQGLRARHPSKDRRCICGTAH